MEARSTTRMARPLALAAGTLPIVACLLLAFADWLVFRPGLISYDSLVQYRQAVTWSFDDANPPLMALGLSVVRFYGGDIGHLMLAQACAGVLGLYALARAVIRHCDPVDVPRFWVEVAAVAVVVALMTPVSPLGYYLMTFWKDSWLIVFLSWSLALALRLTAPGPAAGPRARAALLGSSIGFLVLALLVRHNVILVAPALAALVYLASRRVSVRWAPALAIAPVVLALVVGQGIKRVFHVRESNIDATVMHFELVGVCAYNDDAARRLTTAGAHLRPDYRSRYVAGLFESFEPCLDSGFKDLPRSYRRHVYPKLIRREYGRAARAYPLTLLRLKRDAFLYHFGEGPRLRFHPELIPNEFGLRLNDEFSTFRAWLQGYLWSVFESPVLSWLVVRHLSWIAFNVVLVVVLARAAIRARSLCCLSAALASCVTLGYYLSYLAVSVSADFRYMYPATLINQVALLAIGAGVLLRRSGSISTRAPGPPDPRTG